MGPKGAGPGQDEAAKKKEEEEEETSRRAATATTLQMPLRVARKIDAGRRGTRQQRSTGLGSVLSIPSADWLVGRPSHLASGFCQALKRG